MACNKFPSFVLTCREPRLFSVIEAMFDYAGSSKRMGDLYASRSIMNKAKTMFKGLKVGCECRASEPASFHSFVRKVLLSYC